MKGEVSGCLENEGKLKLINALISNTGDYPQKFVERRIYYKNTADSENQGLFQRYYILRKIDLEYVTKILDYSKCTNNSQFSPVNAFSNSSLLYSNSFLITEGKDDRNEKNISLFSTNQSKLFNDNDKEMNSFLKNIGFDYDNEVIQFGIRFVHYSGINVDLFYFFPLDNPNTIFSFLGSYLLNIFMKSSPLSFFELPPPIICSPSFTPPPLNLHSYLLSSSLSSSFSSSSSSPSPTSSLNIKNQLFQFVKLFSPYIILSKCPEKIS
jgi:hypothetical protein